MIDFRYDEEADAIYIRLSDMAYSYGEELDRERRVDYAADGTPVGVELTCVSTGVDLRDLPQQKVIADLLAKHRIKVLAS
ncbi:MAG: DUF2283 domain-containing protein [Chloroflexi bacterium]|nr:DUF2283 domain-containing protein [Chloroflexota bacterium]